MPRLESQAKAGYYPTPEKVTKLIIQKLQPTAVSPVQGGNTVHRLLDPCCGTGLALQQIAASLEEKTHARVQTYGVELSQERAQEAAKRVDRIMVTDLFGTSIGNEMFSLLFLNPPYDDEANSAEGKKRTEVAFLQRCTPYLAPGSGVLVYIVPLGTIRHMAKFLASHYTSVRCYNFPPDEREAYNQVVIMGRRKSSPYADPRSEDTALGWMMNPETMEDLTQEDMYRDYAVPAFARGEVYFTNLFFHPETVADEAAKSGLWQNRIIMQSIRPDTPPKHRPLMPLRQGHTAMLTAAGFLDNIELESQTGNRVLVKGRTRKEYVVTEDTPDKTVRQERMQTTVVKLDLDTGVFEDIKA